MYAHFADWMRRPGGRSIEIGSPAYGTDRRLLAKGVVSERDVRYARLLVDYQQALAQGQTHKIWIASPDDRTRTSHSAAHGQMQRIDNHFLVGSERMFLPCDPNTTLAETANCRCTVRFVRLSPAQRPAGLVLSDAVDGTGAAPGDQLAQLQPRGPGSRGRGDNGGPPLHDLVSLVQVFPGFAGAPLGAMLAPVDAIFDLTGPAARATESLFSAQRAQLIADIRAIDPGFTYDSLEPKLPVTLEGRLGQLNDLRMIRAATMYRIRNDPGALQVETLRFLQKSVDDAYSDGAHLFNTGQLQPRLSRNEAIGNYMDSHVRKRLQQQYNRYRIDWGRGNNITINNRDYDSSASDAAYRIPDARIGRISFDWTLTRKLRESPQIRGFFSAESMPEAVVIVRPRQIGPDSSYLITR